MILSYEPGMAILDRGNELQGIGDTMDPTR